MGSEQERCQLAAELLGGSTDYLEIYDEQHSEEEERFIAIGPVRGRVIVVAFTERDDDAIRIISARKATKSERGRYEEYENAKRQR